MDFEELQDRYKMFPLWLRMLVAVVLGAVPVAYISFSEGEVLNTQLDDVKSEEFAMQNRFKKARERQMNLPQLEAQKVHTEDQLTKARENLPDEYHIDELLQRIATIAREVGVELHTFDPTEEKIGGGKFKYMELPINTKIRGKFQQVATFFDRVAHLEANIFTKDVKLKSVDKDEGVQENAGAAAPVGAEGEETDAEKAEQKNIESMLERREDLRVDADFALIVFKSASETDIATYQGDEEGEPEEKGKAGG